MAYNRCHMGNLEIETCNCIVCAQEFCPSEMTNVVLCSINCTQFKICQKCLEHSDPQEDFAQVKNIINNYVKISSSRDYIKELNNLIKKSE